MTAGKSVRSAPSDRETVSRGASSKASTRGAFSCGGCDTRWGGFKQCHCAGCHELFSTPQNFDLHRSNGKCLQPGRIRTQAKGLLLKRNERGVWVGAGDKPEGLHGEDSPVDRPGV